MTWKRPAPTVSCGFQVDFHGKWGLPLLPPCRLRRGGDLPGRLRTCNSDLFMGDCHDL